jgi:protein TonB
VVVNVYIGADGVAQKAELKVSSGFERLDAAAVSTAKGWRYVPGKRGGVPEAMWFAVPIIFAME